MLSSILPAIYAIPSRRINPLRPCVVSLGQISGGAVSNVIPKEVYLQGTLRSQEEEVRQQLWDEVERALKLSEFMGGSYELKIQRGYPCLYNDAGVNEWMRAVGRDLLADSAVVNAEFGMGAEDFSYMTQKARGAMFMLGASLADGAARHHHTDVFDIDESVLPIGAAVLAETARRFVTGQLS
jgi:amidohydrolase